MPDPLSGAVSPDDGIGEEIQETPSLGDAEWHRFSRFSSLRELAIVASYWEGGHLEIAASNGRLMLANNLAAALPGTNVCVLENDDMTTECTVPAHTPAPRASQKGCTLVAPTPLP